jgi:hypothetical protein
LQPRFLGPERGHVRLEGAPANRQPRTTTRSSGSRSLVHLEYR